MPQAWRTVRVFVSSTFRDMQAERDHLVRFVFPRLREELLPRRIHLVDVDLRWGVTDDQDAFDLCMKEIDRCRPRFICMLGGRYGWIPAPKAVDADIMNQIRSGVSPAGPLSAQERSVLDALYTVDAQAAIYHLSEKPQQKAQVEIWTAQCEVAVQVLQRAGLPEAQSSITASEVYRGALERLDERAGRYFYFRKPSATASIPADYAAIYCEPAGSPAEKLLEDLKKRISGPQTLGTTAVTPDEVIRAPLPCYEYPCTWDETTRRLTDLDAFGDRVYANLLASVDAQYGTAPPEELDEFEREDAAIEAFLEERWERYVVGSRQVVLDQLRGHADGSGVNGHLCLVGEPGSGKSALLGWFYREYSQAQANADRLVIAHFCGASSASTDLYRVMIQMKLEDPP